MGYQKAELAITAQNMFTPWVNLRGDFNFSIYGTFVGTVTLQRSFDNGVTILDVETQTAPIQKVGTEPEVGVVYRAGIKTGAFTSGTCNVRLSQ